MCSSALWTAKITLCVAVVLILLAGTVRADEVENLLINGDFEEGTTGWSLELRKGAIAEMTIAEEESVKGKQSLFIDIDKLDDVDYCVMLRQLYSIKKAGETYTFCVWAKCEKKGARKIILVVQKSTDPWTSYSRKSFDINDEWKEYWMTFTAAEETTVRTDVRLGMNLEDLWVDNIRFYKGEYVEEKIEEQEAVVSAGKLPTAWAMIKAKY